MTDFEEWRIYWFPDSENATKATELDYSLVTDNIDTDTATYRVLHCTKVLTGMDAANMPTLAKSLVSVLSKMNYGKKSLDISKISLLSIGRSCILMDNDSWFWTSLQSNDLIAIRNSKNLPLVPSGKGTKQFILLRDYHGGADGRVWLVAGATNGQLAVIKFLRRARNRPKDDEAVRMKEEIVAWDACGISVHSCIVLRECVTCSSPTIMSSTTIYKIEMYP